MINIISTNQVNDPNNIDTGELKISITNSSNIPITDATISIANTGGGGTLESVNSNASGQTDLISLSAPPLEYSLDINNNQQPYSEYTVNVSAPGYDSLDLSGIQILAGTVSNVNATLTSSNITPTSNNIVIPPHTLYSEYGPKIAEEEIKPFGESSESILSHVVIPEYVVVHDGLPSDKSANDYYILYSDYIKNVASSEVYATWPEATITANVLAIMSFTLNRVYTEWYHRKGYDYTVTTSTAYDRKFMYGRNIYDRISNIVDNIFNNYLARPNVKQPILTQYCDGKQSICPQWMAQWGSKALGDQGYSAIEILRNYYGNSMYINTATKISGVPSAWPGYDLDIGASGEKVTQLQEQLNRIGQVYGAIPKISLSGIYQEDTKNTVLQFQKIFSLPQTGIANFATWYKISQIYVGIIRIAEPNS